jgi:hypothetical protein
LLLCIEIMAKVTKKVATNTGAKHTRLEVYTSNQVRTMHGIKNNSKMASYMQYNEKQCTHTKSQHQSVLKSHGQLGFGFTVSFHAISRVLVVLWS